MERNSYRALDEHMADYAPQIIPEAQDPYVRPTVDQSTHRYGASDTLQREIAATIDSEDDGDYRRREEAIEQYDRVAEKCAWMSFDAFAMSLVRLVTEVMDKTPGAIPEFYSRHQSNAPSTIDKVRLYSDCDFAEDIRWRMREEVIAHQAPIRQAIYRGERR